MQSGRFLYDASLAINPPRSPYDLYVYSRDMTRSSVTTDTLPALSNGNNLIVPDMPTDLTRTGTNIESGLRLVIANKRGMGSAANRLLADIPAIHVEYRDLLNRNNEGGSRIDSHYSKLKVAAGGMGDTWLIYEGSEFTDKYIPENNYTLTRITFGTINQYQRRKWVQFTNWIKLSADARFEQTKQGNSDQNTEEFDLNIFGTATRRLWEAKIFSNYNRKFIGGGAATQELRLPLYVSGVWGANTDWSLNASTKELRNGGGGQTSRSSEESLSLRLNTFKRSPFTLTSTLTLTNRSDTSGGGVLGADVGLETVSTSRFARSINLAGSYHLRNRYNKASESYSYNQDLLLDAYYQPSSAWKVSFRETMTQGKNDVNTDSFASSTVAQGQNPLGSVTDLTTPTSEFLRLSTKVSTTWTPVARLSLNLSGTNYVQFESNGNDSMSNALGASVSYAQPTFTASAGVNAAYQDTGEQDLSADTRVDYRPNRSLEASLRGRATYRKSADASYRFVDAAQRLIYYIWGTRGISRKVADLYEEGRTTPHGASSLRDRTKAADDHKLDEAFEFFAIAFSESDDSRHDRLMRNG